jgi:hypothetical protein
MVMEMGTQATMHRWEDNIKMGLKEIIHICMNTGWKVELLILLCTSFEGLAVLSLKQ